MSDTGYEQINDQIIERSAQDVPECYNTCFVIEDNGRYFMVDGGGGSTILHQLKHAGYNWMDMRHIFVTHKHIEHLTGIIWLFRMICQFMNHGEYKGEAYIYSHKVVLDLLLYHTEDENLDARKKLYHEEGSRYYHGNLFIPDDLESLPQR